MQTPQRAKIVLVEDNELIRNLARGMLSKYGFEVITLDGPFGFGKSISCAGNNNRG